MINAGEGRGVCSATWNGHDEYGNRYEQEVGCLNNLPTEAFRDQRSSTICDMCYYNKGIDLERIIPKLEWLLSVYPTNRWTKKYQRERTEKITRYTREWTDATVRILQRGDKPTARAIATEAGVSVGVIYKYLKRKPVTLLTSMAKKRIEAHNG